MEGDAEMAAKRIEVLQGLSLLELSEAAQELAKQFLATSNLPPKAAEDAAHPCDRYSPRDGLPANVEL